MGSVFTGVLTTHLTNALIPSQLPEWTVALKGCRNEETEHYSHDDRRCPVVGLRTQRFDLDHELRSLEQQHRADIKQVVCIFELLG